MSQAKYQKPPFMSLNTFLNTCPFRDEFFPKNGNHSVYLLTSTDNEVFYVGETVQSMSDRLEQHRKDAHQVTHLTRKIVHLKSLHSTGKGDTNGIVVARMQSLEQSEAMEQRILSWIRSEGFQMTNTSEGGRHDPESSYEVARSAGFSDRVGALIHSGHPIPGEHSAMITNVKHAKFNSAVSIDYTLNGAAKNILIYKTHNNPVYHDRNMQRILKNLAALVPNVVGKLTVDEVINRLETVFKANPSATIPVKIRASVILNDFGNELIVTDIVEKL